MEFTCNICRLDPELSSCSQCGSNIRFRWLAHRLSRELFGRALPLHEWPVDRSVRGLGLTDPEVLAVAKGFSSCGEETLKPHGRRI